MLLLRRVVQIATSTYDNQFVCSESNAPAPEGPPATDSPNTCLVVQTSESGDNVALCREVSGSSSVTQTCTLIQQNSTGTNRNGSPGRHLARVGKSTEITVAIFGYPPVVW